MPPYQWSTLRLLTFTVICLSAVRGGPLYDLYMGNPPDIIHVDGPALDISTPTMILNNREFRIIGGTMHYFRTHPAYWRDHMRKMKAGGLNTVETYLAWNMHEKIRGEYVFSEWMDIRRYLQIAQEEDLFVILRPGPYICSEFDFGGYPSWLLRNESVELRVRNEFAEVAIEAWFQQWIQQVQDLQFTYGGPVILVQIENEYGYFDKVQTEYLAWLRDLMIQNGIVETFATSDGPQSGKKGTIDGVLMTGNFQKVPAVNFDLMIRLQPDRPLMGMELWTGWFDRWGGAHSTFSTEDYLAIIQAGLDRNASVNMYMYFGGTDFNLTSSNFLTTSYDYDAPLTEAGDYTEKYHALKDLFIEYSRGKPWEVPLPDEPTERVKADYGEVTLNETLSLEDALAIVPTQNNSGMSQLIMELLDVNQRNGQSFGFVLFRTDVLIADSGSTLTLDGPVLDRGQVFVNGDLLAVVQGVMDPDVDIPSQYAGSQTIDILVESLGRVNGPNEVDNRALTVKGLYSSVSLDGSEIAYWDIYSLQFDEDFNIRVSQQQWSSVNDSGTGTPGFFRGFFEISQEPQDTFLNLQGFNHGVSVINGHVVGRYWNVGPQRTLYVPAPFLKQGINEVVLFETDAASNAVSFQDTPILGRRGRPAPDFRDASLANYLKQTHRVVLV